MPLMPLVPPSPIRCAALKDTDAVLNDIDGASMSLLPHRWSIDVVTGDEDGWPAGLPGRMRQVGLGTAATLTIENR
jgi:hypothetical protein